MLVIGTFDTKAEELNALADEVEVLGGKITMLDTSARFAERPAAHLLGGRTFIDQDQVAHAAGSTCAAISALPRGEAVSALRAGVSRLLHQLLDAGDIVVGFGSGLVYLVRQSEGTLVLRAVRIVP